MKNTKKTRIAQKKYLFPCIALSCLTGVLTGAMIFLFKIAIKYVQRASEFIYGTVRSNPSFLPLLLLGAIAIGLVSFVLIKFFPIIRGSGIPNSLAILRGFIPFKWVRSLFGIFASTLLTFLVGVPLGNEGPAVQMGSSIGKGSVNLLGKGNKAWERYTMTGGACGGFAAATGAPLTGIIFAIEEAHRRFSPIIFMAASTATLAATMTMTGLCKLFPALEISPKLFDVPASAALPLKHFWLAIAIGLTVGAISIAFTKLYKLFNGLMNQTLKKIPLIVKVITIFALVALIGFFLDGALGSGHAIIDAIFESHAPIWYTLIALLLIRALLLLISTNTGITGGTLIPLITFGAILGSLISSLVVTTGILPAQYSGAIVLISLSSFLAASSRTPLTAIILAVEIFSGFDNIIMIAIGVAFAYLTIEFSNAVSFNDLISEQKIHETHRGKELITVNATFEVKDNAFVIGKEIRDILWPPYCAVISVKKYVIGSSILAKGDILQIRYQTYDPQESFEIMEALLGKQDEQQKPDGIKEESGYHVPHS